VLGSEVRNDPGTVSTVAAKRRELFVLTPALARGPLIEVSTLQRALGLYVHPSCTRNL